ncbi:MAG: hypothetical protein H6Q30_2991, partial [Bacteroidetes bacterium]|nr:hypothetical protein [Bacteroidota bacterium]
PELIEAPVRSVMGPRFPCVHIDTPIEDVVRLMSTKHNPAVLVEDNDEITGILSRYDVIEFLGK